MRESFPCFPCCVHSLVPVGRADPANGGNLGPIQLATGSYQVNTAGLHTLSTLMSASDSIYYTGPGNAQFANFDGVLFDSASITVTPEPASLAMMGIAVCGAWSIRRRRESGRGESQSA